MFDFSNIFFVLIAAAVLIVRTVLQVKRKQEPPKKTQSDIEPPKPVKAAHKISVHFEDDEDSGYFKSKAPARSPGNAAKKKKVSDFARSRGGSFGKLEPSKAGHQSVPLSPPAGITEQRQAQAGSASGTAVLPPGQHGFPFNVNRLPPLKQAVVMAEILGTPKGLL